MTKKKLKTKNDNYLMIFIKSFVIGLGIIFPISASFLAVVLGMYQTILDVVNNIFDKLKNDFKLVLSIVLGIGCSCIVSCLLINYTYNKFPVATLLLFCGLILGGIPTIFKKTNKEYNLLNFIFLIIGAALLISISFINSGSAILNTDIKGLLIILLVGILAAGTMIIPGVSGSAILVIIGFYEPLLEVIHDTLHFQNLGSNLLIVASFGVGMIIGLVIMSKLMDYFLKKFEVKSYFMITGFILASCVNIFIKLFDYKIITGELVVGIILFIVGFFISFKYIKED